MSLKSFQFDDKEIKSANSFTALLEFPPNQAAELLHSPEEATPDVKSLGKKLKSSATKSDGEKLPYIHVHDRRDKEREDKCSDEASSRAGPRL
ncbi:hypothetical protein L6452_37386 [Arctium lappa]|uniref:Uncharacterized protein n=1 Tax=Arctium lappa TaxID=4217 RepID=A0ACB8Y3W1_ARCLA|nr:hypothetical protein L6452_37386 [Arctium lappa]